MTKIKIIEIDDTNKNFNFFHEFISMNFLYNGNLNFPVQWNLPSIYFIKDVSETQNVRKKNKICIYYFMIIFDKL